MTRISSLINHPWLPIFIAFVFCCLLGLLGAFSRPIFPVDETRYLTVAWEMFGKGEWILPSLNFESYHHKPPLLFWLIKSMWDIFGVSDQAALAIPYIISFVTACCVARLARVLAPTRPTLPLIATLLFLGSFPFLIYSNLIMFDMLLTIPVLIGITSIWQYAQTQQGRYLLLFGLAVGIGVLAKGPVILLHLLFPVILMKFWAPRTIKIENWTAGFIGAIAIGAVTALAWAVPAAIKGGPEFAYKIFWGQSAGRMKDSFDHARPIWWYLPFLVLFFLPWMTSPALWRGLRFLKIIPEQPVLKFILCWAIPVFLSFSMISGKQVHYLLPLIPAMIMIFALAFDEVRNDMRRFDFIFPLFIALFLTLLPFISKEFGTFFASIIRGIHVEDSFGRVSSTISISLACMIIIFTGLAIKLKSLNSNIFLVSTSMLIFMLCFHAEFKRGFYINYDLQPIADIITKNPKIPLAYARNYHGEWGYLARLDRPVKQVGIVELKVWFKQNPNGMAFIRTKDEAEFAPYDILFRMPYRLTGNYAIVVPKGKLNTYMK